MAEESIILISKEYAESNLIERGEYTELENKVDGKQDTLTAGTGINLNNNTISVDTATSVGTSNLPVTASAVNTKLGDYATTSQLNNKQDNVGFYVNGYNVNLDNKGISQGGAAYENFFEGPTEFANGVVIQSKKPVLDVKSSDGSVTVTRSSDGYGVDLKAKSGGSTDSNPRFRIVTWNSIDPMAYFGKRPARPEDAIRGGITLEQFNSGCQECCSSAFAAALNEYTWLVTRGEGMWNDNDFGMLCWAWLNSLNDGYECHWCDLPESTLPL